jgi:hypothetical protein
MRRIKVLLAGMFAAGPKTYDLRLGTSLARTVSFQGGWLLRGGFLGSCLIQGVGRVRRLVSLCEPRSFVELHWTAT